MYGMMPALANGHNSYISSPFSMPCREMKGPKIDANGRERGTLKVVTMVSIKKKSDGPYLGQTNQSLT